MEHSLCFANKSIVPGNLQALWHPVNQAVQHSLAVISKPTLFLLLDDCLEHSERVERTFLLPDPDLLFETLLVVI